MKKTILLTSALFAISITTTAQIKMDPSGKILVGDFSSSYTGRHNMSIGSLSSKDSCGITFTTSAIETDPFHIYRKGTTTFMGNTSSNRFRGLKFTGAGYASFYGNLFYMLPDRQFITPYATIHSINYLYPSILATGSSTSGVIASATTSEGSYFYTGYYVNASNTKTLNFYAKGDGTVYAKNGLIQSSDISKKENVDSISPQTALSALTSLHGVSFDYKKDKQNLSSMERMQDVKNSLSTNAELDEETKKALNEFEDIPEEIRAQMEKEESRKRIGLIAQEVEAVVPEVVRTLPDGSKGIMYTDLIALVVEGMKEIQATVQKQNARIDSLEKKVVFYKSLVPFNTINIIPPASETESQQDGRISSSLGKEVVLYQNTPNPFSVSTEITYTLPEEMENSLIRIYDLNGQIVKQYPLQSHSGKITVQGNELESGTYIYVLIGGGEVLASRKMVKS